MYKVKSQILEKYSFLFFRSTSSLILFPNIVWLCRANHKSTHTKSTDLSQRYSLDSQPPPFPSLFTFPFLPVITFLHKISSTCLIYQVQLHRAPLFLAYPISKLDNGTPSKISKAQKMLPGGVYCDGCCSFILKLQSRTGYSQYVAARTQWASMQKKLRELPSTSIVLRAESRKCCCRLQR